MTTPGIPVHLGAIPQPHPLEVAETPLGEMPLCGMTDNPGIAERRKYNKQLYQNSAKVGESDYLNSGDVLANDQPPNFCIQHERPEHRLVVYLKATGHSNQEIAQKTGYSYNWVCQIVRQPWFRKAFLEECKAAGKDSIKAFLSGEVMESLTTLVEIRDNEKSKEAVRVAAANAILDRALGKPTQHIEAKTLTGSIEAHKEMEDLNRELEAVKAQQKAFGVGTN